MGLPSIHPASEAVLNGAPPAGAPLSKDAIEQRLTGAEQAGRACRDAGMRQRARWMRRLAGSLEQDAEELAVRLTAVTGRTIGRSRDAIRGCAGICLSAAEEGERREDPEDAYRPGTAEWQPCGVVLLVVSRHAPLGQMFAALASALAGGNAVLVQQEGVVADEVLELETAVRRAGFPRGAVQTLAVEPWQLETVFNDCRVNALAAIGDEKTGRSLAARAGWLGKKSLVETAGAGAVVVMPTADLVRAMQAAVVARCFENGQSSLSPARFVVHERVYEDFALLFAAAMEEVRTGDPLDAKTELGPLTDERSVQVLEKQVAAAVRAGGRILTGGQRLSGAGHFFAPTVLADVPWTAKVCGEEISGPVALLFKVGSAQEAVSVANRGPAALAMSVWTMDEEEERLFRGELKCECLFLNTAADAAERLELSGFGQRSFVTRKRTVRGLEASRRSELESWTVAEPETLVAEAPVAEMPWLETVSPEIHPEVLMPGTRFFEEEAEVVAEDEGISRLLEELERDRGSETLDFRSLLSSSLERVERESAFEMVQDVPAEEFEEIEDVVSVSSVPERVVEKSAGFEASFEGALRAIRERAAREQEVEQVLSEPVIDEVPAMEEAGQPAKKQAEPVRSAVREGVGNSRGQGWKSLRGVWARATEQARSLLPVRRPIGQAAVVAEADVVKVPVVLGPVRVPAVPVQAVPVQEQMKAVAQPIRAVESVEGSQPKDLKQLFDKALRARAS
jgi:succinate-semialdehyde dehydrogenase/glutarate-semialdehyde dehydrogenase